MPDWKYIVRDHIRPLRLEGSAESNIVDELAQHLEDRYNELRSGGASESEAYGQTISELGDLHPLKARTERTPRLEKFDAVPAGDSRPGNFLEDLWRDLRYAFRAMRKSPTFVLFVILTLALGIGANTTVFTVINTLILNPLPVPNSSRLAALSVGKTKNVSKSSTPLPMSYADLKDYQDRNEVFRSLAGYTSWRLITLETHADSKRKFTELVTGNYFSTLGLNPAKGRFFLPDEGGSPGAHPVAVINYGTWKADFGGAADIVGKTLRINRIVFTVIGVAPPGFIGVNAVFGPDFWIPAAMGELLLPNEMKDVLTDRGKPIFHSVGRLKPGVTRAQAQANLATLASALAREFPATDEGQTAMVRPINDVLFTSSTGSSTPILAAGAGLLLVVGIVLLIACSNVANLLLARSAARQQEMAIRLAIGASRQRLVRQLLTESVLLGLLSGVVGVVIAYAGLRLLFGALPSTSNFIAPKLDATVLVFSLLVSLATGFLFGTLPALRASRGNVAETLKEETHTMGRNQGKVTLANVLLVGQVAFSFLLLVVATLFLRSIGRAYAIDPGFQTAHLAVFMTNPGQTGYAKPQAKAYYKDVRERVTRLPGVASVSWASNFPLWAGTTNGLRIEGRQPRSQADTITTVVNTIETDYFETAGVTIDAGRAFANLDEENSTPVAIVNEKLAHAYWPGGQALGKRIQLPGEKQMRQIVGIAKNANYTHWGEPPQLCVYVPFEQHYSDAMNLYVRSVDDPRQILTSVQNEMRAAAPQVLVTGIQTGRDVINGGLFGEKMGVGLLSVFGLLALGLASIGLYGIMAYSVSQRKREIGLRIALGAARTNVLWLILQQGMSLVLTGVLIGFAAALLAGRMLSRMLYGVSASDPVSVAGAAAVLLAVALLACYLPARWASRVDPLVALREG
ncbi:MAG TPA: ABC transporter permease [Bryobacteraceae bacterium]|nr:ABC transporter permease [Bryobacteraceae bacterium]